MLFKKLRLLTTNRLDIEKKINKLEISDDAYVKYNNIRIKGKNNVIFIKNRAIVKNCTIEINGDNNEIHIYSEKIAKIKIQSISNNSIIKFENGSNVQDSAINLFSNAGEIVIGENTTFTSVNIVCEEEKNRVLIGKNCMFSYGVNIRNTDSHPIFNENNEIINIGKEVIIGNRVWIGEGTTVLKGVSIADGRVIGAKSLVTKNIKEAGSISVGIPSKVIKENIKWERKFIREITD